jgi:hypothetical protein
VVGHLHAGRARDFVSGRLGLLHSLFADCCKLCRLLALMSLLMVVVGCQRKPPTGEVSGQVSVDGAAVQFGTIAFISAEGRAVTSNINHGAYKASGVPTGKTQVTVQAVRLGTPVGHPTLGPLPTTEVAGKFVAVPDRYSMPKTSGLECDVVAGAQTKDFDLEAK